VDDVLEQEYQKVMNWLDRLSPAQIPEGYTLASCAEERVVVVEYCDRIMDGAKADEEQVKARVGCCLSL